jgi:hypothetical protein
MKRTKNLLVFVILLFSYLLSLIKWRNTSYFSWNTIHANCVSILYKKCCRVVLLTKRTFFIIFFFANVSDFVLCPRVTFFPFFTNVQCHIIKNLLTSTVRAVRENIQPRSCCIDLAIARSIQQDLGWYFPVLPSLSVSKLLLF